MITILILAGALFAGVLLGRLAMRYLQRRR